MAVVIKTFQFNPFGENTYVVHDESTREAAVIDPGMMYDYECKELSDYIRQADLTVKLLINTHIHVDHVAGDEYVEQTYGVALSASPLDEFLASRIAEQARMFHLPFSFPEKLSIGHPLNDGDRLSLGDETIEVIAIPGHSPGSIGLYLPASGALFSGDALFERSIGRTDLPGGNYAQLIKSLTNRVLTLPADTKVYPGHGSPTTVGDESRFNPFL